MAELLCGRGQRLEGPAGPPGQPVQVPPACPVAGQVQDPVGAPFGLEHRLPGPAGNGHRVAGQAVAAQLGQPQLGPVPGHVRVVPFQPGQAAAVGADPGAGVEVAPGGQHDRLATHPAAVGRQHDQLVVDLAVVVVFANADQPPAVGGRAEVGVAVGGRGRRLGGDRDRPGRARVLAVQALVGVVAEEHGVAVDGVGAAAVLVHPGAGVESLGGQVGGLPVRSGLDPADDLAAAFQRAALDPVDGSCLDPDLVERHPAGGDQLGADRRAPGAVGGGGGHAVATRGARSCPGRRARAGGGGRRTGRLPARCW